MTRFVSAVLAALLLWSLSAVRPERSDASEAPVAAEGAPFLAAAARPLSLRDHRNTLWMDDADGCLMIYSDGEAYLFAAHEIFALTEEDGVLRLETRLFRTACDAEPALTLPVGTVRMETDGRGLMIQAADDPLGVLAFDGLDGMVLYRVDEKPYRYPDHNFASLPLEPGTDWFAYFNRGDYRYARLNMTVQEDGSFTGTLAMPEGTTRSCALLSNEDGFALVDDSGAAPELLLYGQRNRDYEKSYDRDRYQLIRLELNTLYDALGLCDLDAFDLRRQYGGEGERAYMLGRTLDAQLLSLLREGWQDTTGDFPEDWSILEEYFVRLQKDGQTLLIYFASDYVSPYESWLNYPAAYVLYGADGSVLEWSGSKPIDHGIADGFRVKKGVYFDPGEGVRELLIGEDSAAYFLDDGRLVIESSAHLESASEVGGTVALKIIPIVS